MSFLGTLSHQLLKFLGRFPFVASIIIEVVGGLIIWWSLHTDVSFLLAYKYSYFNQHSLISITVLTDAIIIIIPPLHSPSTSSLDNSRNSVINKNTSGRAFHSLTLAMYSQPSPSVSWMKKCWWCRIPTEFMNEFSFDESFTFIHSCSQPSQGNTQRPEPAIMLYKVFTTCGNRLIKPHN